METPQTVILISLTFLLLVALFAAAEAKRDARLIREGKVIEHVERWGIRAMVVMLGVCIAFVLSLPSFLNPLLLCVASSFLFSACFRYCLNKRRGKHWAYIAPWSNWYDRVWYAIACLTWWSNAHLRSHKILLKDYEKSTIVDGSDIHRAGRLAYITEILLTLAALVWVACIN